MLDPLNAVVTLFVTIDPVGLAPVFVVLTAGMTRGERRAVALRASLIGGIVLVGFALVGEPLIGVLGISLPAFRIAGGLLLFAIAFEMVFGRRDRRKSSAAHNAAERDDPRHVAAFPLAVPLIAGPGAISATILLAAQAPGVVAIAGLIAIIVALIGICISVFVLAAELDRALGDTGRIVVTRLLGVILAALSVQFVADGVRALAAGG